MTEEIKIDEDVKMIEKELSISEIRAQHELNINDDILDSLVKEFNELKVTTNLEFSKTANGALALKSSGNYLLDFFAKCGALRNKPNDLKTLFLLSLAENPTYTMKCLFYMRDIRNGQGERWSFRTIMKMLALDDNLKKFAERNMPFIREFGRFDDIIYAFEGTMLEEIAFKYLKNVLDIDISSVRPSLLAKWLPSENASSLKTKKLAKRIRTQWNYPAKKYRKTLSKLRKQTSVIETKISKKEWSNIEYPKVPSLAFKRYNKAFAKHNWKNYEKYLNRVKSGEAKINTGTLYPYDLVRHFLFHKDNEKMTQSTKDTYDVMWNNLPNYVDKNEVSIVVVDVSGSMMKGYGSVPPICVAISLGIYIGDRMPHKGFLTFSETPRFEKIIGETLEKKIYNMAKADWGYNTDIQAVFNLVLDMQLKDINSYIGNKAIKKIYIISDMEFDENGNSKMTNHDEIKQKYVNAKLSMPQLVYWNVDSNTNTCEASSDEKNTILVSGCSPTILKTAMNNSTPYHYMMKVLNKDIYSKIY